MSSPACSPCPTSPPVRVADIERNAGRLTAMLSAGGSPCSGSQPAKARRPPSTASCRSPGAKRTLMFYAHYDGQPVDQKGWLSDPFKPVLRSGPLGPGSRRRSTSPAVTGPLDPEWRIYARSASDDKSPIVAILTALDALARRRGRALGQRQALPRGGGRAGLAAPDRDPAPQRPAARRRRLAALRRAGAPDAGGCRSIFGARGVTGLELTVYGPLRPLHSGHYGNWAPNPAVTLAHLVASLRDEEGRILIPGFYDDVRPLTAAERQAVAAPCRRSRTRWRRSSASAAPKAAGPRLQDRLMDPALNVRGLRAAEVGEGAANAIPTEAQVSIDFRLVPDQTPRKVKEQGRGLPARQGLAPRRRGARPRDPARHPQGGPHRLVRSTTPRTAPT